MAENMGNDPKESLWEENEAPQLAKLKRDTPFTVPSNYFDGLTERINQSVFINSLEKVENAGFSSPQDYFEVLESQIISKINIAKFKDDKNQGFTVPDGYFEELQKNINAKTTARKVLKLWHQPLFKYAIAASLVIVSATGWFTSQHYQNKQSRSAEFAKEQLLYDIHESVIEEYILESQNAKTNSVTEVELEKYILDNFSTNELSNSL